MIRGVRSFITVFAFLLLWGCGGSSGDVSDVWGTQGRLGYAGSSFDSSSLGGPRDAGPGSGEPRSFTPTESTPSPSPTPTHSPAPVGPFVQAGASGSGSESDPGGDLAAALASTPAGSSVVILYSPTPLTFSGRLTIPHGVTLEGRAEPATSNPPVVAGSFLVGSDVTISGFHSRLNNNSINFDLTDSRDVAFTDMTIEGRIVYDNASGDIHLSDSRMLGGMTSYGTISSGQARVIVDGCQLAYGSNWHFEATGGGTEADFIYSNNSSEAPTRVVVRDAVSNVRIEDNQLSNNSRSGDTIEYHGTSSGDVSFAGNTVTGGTGLFFRKNDAGGGGAVRVEDNVFQGALHTAYTLFFLGGAYDLIGVNNQATNNISTGGSFGTFDDFVVHVGGNAQLRARLQDNLFYWGLRFFVGGAPTINAGFFNNSVGVHPDGSGTGRRQLGFFSEAVGFTATITSIFQSNIVGTTAVNGNLVIREDSGTVAVERRPDLTSDNTVNGSLIVDPGVATASDGSTDLPPYP